MRLQSLARRLEKRGKCERQDSRTLSSTRDLNTLRVCHKSPTSITKKDVYYAWAGLCRRLRRSIPVADTGLLPVYWYTTRQTARSAMLGSDGIVVPFVEIQTCSKQNSARLCTRSTGPGLLPACSPKHGAHAHNERLCIGCWPFYASYRAFQIMARNEF